MRQICSDTVLSSSFVVGTERIAFFNLDCDYRQAAIQCVGKHHYYAGSQPSADAAPAGRSSRKSICEFQVGSWHLPQ
jgi:hypothetical protein